MCQEIIDYLTEENKKSEAEMAATPGLYIGLWSLDPEHWAEYKTIEEWKIDMAIEAHYNVYKSYVGIKPRWESFDNMTSDEIEAMTRAFVEREENYERKAAEARVRRANERALERRQNKRKCTPKMRDIWPVVA